MKIKIQITVESDDGQLKVAQDVAHLDRGTLRPETLGLTLAEARSILAGIEQTVVEQQAAEFMAQQRTCSHCGHERPCKGRHHIVFRTPFGKLRLESPRLYHCQCESDGRTSFSPLAELLQERSSPELVYLETKFAALVSYGLTVELFKEVLPISQELSTTAIRQRVRQTAQRLEDELGEEQHMFIGGCQRDWDQLPDPAASLIVGIDGGYVHARDQQSRAEGWFEVIVGKSMSQDGESSKCLGFVKFLRPEAQTSFVRDAQISRNADEPSGHILIGRRRHCPRSPTVPESAGRASSGLVSHFDEADGDESASQEHRG